MSAANERIRGRSCIKSTQIPASLIKAERNRRHYLSGVLSHPLDRVNVLGNDSTYGHTGCVNALSWARDGELLLSGGDDTTVRIWSMDPANNTQEYPFVCRSVIQTGHRANIFSTQMLPYSSRIATVAGDKQVRVFDIGEPRTALRDSRETSYSPRQACTHILRCHGDRVKRIVTEHSPDLFLSVGEDGSVRQHDLRTPHDCRKGTCPTPLVKVNHELSTLTLSPLTPYQFVVAGEAPYGYLFDRRHTGRFLQEEWGIVPRYGEDLTTCVRRFGKPKKPANERRFRSEHITGARMSTQNGHEVLLSYSADGVYIYSTADDPDFRDSISSTSSHILSSNTKRRKIDEASGIGKPTHEFNPTRMDLDEDFSECPSNSSSINTTEGTDNSSGNEGEDEDEDEDEDDCYLEFTNSDETDESSFLPHIPVVMPRRHFIGARNVATIKDVNFLGPTDEFVTSGSDDGNFFIWNKATGVLHGIYEGDSNVVNMVEGHPHLPLIAVSGIDTTVKLFAPNNGPSQFSKMADAQRIVEVNTRPGRIRTIRYSLATLLAEARVVMGANEADAPECRSQ